MKRITTFLFVLALSLAFSMQANAALELRGTDNQGNRLIYDTDFNITWYDYTKSDADWQTQMNWASALSVSGGDLVGVYDDWRLPIIFTQDCWDFNCTNSEIGHLYYTELGNVAEYSLTKTGDFQKLHSNVYWSGTEYAAATNSAGYFTSNGYQGASNKGNGIYAIAVRPGDVSVAVAPEPVSMILFGVGGVVLGARRMVKRRRG